MISGRKSSTIQLKKFCGKCCRVYAAHVLEAVENDAPRLEGFMCCKNSRMFSLMRFQGLLQRGTSTSQLNLCLEQTSVQDTLQDEHTRVARAEDAAARVVGKELYQVKCVPLGSVITRSCS